MEKFVVIALFALILGGFGWVLYQGHRLLKAQDEARALLAMKRDWTYASGRPVNFTFHGRAEGSDWSFEYRTEVRGKKSHCSAHWCAPALRAPRLTWLVLGRARARSEGGLAAQFLSGLLALRLPGERAGVDDRQAFLEHARELPVAALKEQFAVLALPGAPAPAVDDEIVRRLLRWPAAAGGSGRGTQMRITSGAGGVRMDRRSRGGFAPADQVELRWDSEGLHIYLHEPPAEAAMCEHVIDLGLALLARAGATRRAA